MRWKRNNTVVYNVAYHIIWTTKYRKKLLVGKIIKRLNNLLDVKSKEIGFVIEKREIMPDHLHIFVKADPAIAIPYIVYQLKGYTSRILRQEFKILRTRLPSLWTRSYYVETVGNISEKVIKKYIEDQKTK